MVFEDFVSSESYSRVYGMRMVYSVCWHCGMLTLSFTFIRETCSVSKDAVFTFIWNLKVRNLIYEFLTSVNDK